jgi:catechol 2,3-dioxygenase-like lactoylglutathione lyase family enzyme
MAGKKEKEKKKARKAAKKARKEAKRAARKAAKLAAKQTQPQGPRKVAKAARKIKKAVKKAAKKSARKAAKAARVAPAPKGRVHQDRKQPESLRLHSAGPSFTVDDLDKSLAFYRDVLGFTQKDQWMQDGVVTGVELVAGSVTFWLGQDDWKKGRGRVKGEGFRIYCGTTQDVDALAARVRATGTSLADEPRDMEWGGRAFAVRDPDGFLVTIATGV